VWALHPAAVARTPNVPLELTKRPFSLEEARAAGLTLSSLRGKAWRRLGAELYCWHGLHVDPWLLLAAWRDLLPADAVFAGATAAWMLGLDFHPTNPVSIVVPPSAGIRSRTGLCVRRCHIQPREAVTVRGLRATTLPRTLLDLCVQWAPVEALIAMDMAVHLGLIDVAILAGWAAAVQGRPGAGRFRSLARIAGPAESPMETRLRWLLIQARLPCPELQTNLHDGDKQFVGRADLYYPAARLVLEFDGGNHRERLVEDDRRQNRLINAGFHLLRFTSADVHGRPDVVVAQVRGALAVAPLRSIAPKRALGMPDGHTRGDKSADSGPKVSWWRGGWRRGRDLNSRWASDP
jgi:very-short-patch-repair endonuclease